MSGEQDTAARSAAAAAESMVELLRFAEIDGDKETAQKLAWLPSFNSSQKA